jgi:hypothetical protein
MTRVAFGGQSHADPRRVLTHRTSAGAPSVNGGT